MVALNLVNLVENFDIFKQKFFVNFPMRNFNVITLATEVGYKPSFIFTSPK